MKSKRTFAAQLHTWIAWLFNDIFGCTNSKRRTMQCCCCRNITWTGTHYLAFAHVIHVIRFIRLATKCKYTTMAQRKTKQWNSNCQCDRFHCATLQSKSIFFVVVVLPPSFIQRLNQATHTNFHDYCYLFLMSCLFFSLCVFTFLSLNCNYISRMSEFNRKPNRLDQ